MKNKNGVHLRVESNTSNTSNWLVSTYLCVDGLDYDIDLSYSVFYKILSVKKDTKYQSYYDVTVVISDVDTSAVFDYFGMREDECNRFSLEELDELQTRLELFIGSEYIVMSCLECEEITEFLEERKFKNNNEIYNAIRFLVSYLVDTSLCYRAISLLRSRYDEVILDAVFEKIECCGCDYGLTEKQVSELLRLR